MINSLLKVWLESALKFPPALKDALRFFEDSAGVAQEHSILVSSDITKAKHGYIARWTGSELLVLPLSKIQQRDFGLRGYEMKTVRHQLPAYGAVTHKPLVGLSEFQFQLIEHHAQNALNGTVQLTFDNSTTSPLSTCALGVEYYSPAVQIPLFQYFYPSGRVLPGKLPFRRWLRRCPILILGPLWPFFVASWSQKVTRLTRVPKASAILWVA
jgi:hypothetical protein